MSDVAVRTTNLGKRYRIYKDPMDRVVELLSGRRVVRHQEKWAVRGVSFELPRGAAIGIIGSNGAGKSTLLKMMSGTTIPTEGSFEINGRLGSLLELGAGFHPGFTGRMNVFMNASIMGISRQEVRDRFRDIAEFADLGDYLNRPVRTYSSGMAMRLGFAVAMMIDPEILILDEVMAVGDQHFQKKCMDKLAAIRSRGTTILLVSHSMYHVRQMCNHAIWLDEGVVRESGDPRAVTDSFTDYQYEQTGLREGRERLCEVEASEDEPRLLELAFHRAGEAAPHHVFKTGDVLEMHLGYRNPGGAGRYGVTFSVTRNDDVPVFCINSWEARQYATGPEGVLKIRIPLRLTAGEYYVTGALTDAQGEKVYDRRLKWGRFKVRYDGMEKGLILPECRWMTPEEARS